MGDDGAFVADGSGGGDWVGEGSGGDGATEGMGEFVGGRLAVALGRGVDVGGGVLVDVGVLVIVGEGVGE